MAQPLNNEIIDAAIEGFEAQKQRIDDRIAELRSMRDGSSTESSSKADTTPGKRKFSPDALRRMREAQQRRWAKARGEAEPAAPAASPQPAKKRRLSAAGRKAIQEALRRRWAQKRAEGTASQSGAKSAAKKKAAGSSATARKRGPGKKAAKKTPIAASPAAS